MPYQDDYAFVGHGMPILYPASTGEFLTLGLHAIALSRYSGCWVALKLVGQLADGGETVHVAPDDPGIVLPELLIDGKPFRKSTDFTFFPGLNIETERQLYYERHRAVLAYARANSLTWAEIGARGDRMGLVTAGKSHADLRQALLDLGLDESALRRLGVRLLRIGLIYPLDADAIRAFARELDEIVVVEEKRGFLEGQVKEALAGLRRGVRVLGKADEAGAPLFPIQGGMDSDVVAERLGPRLLRLAEGQPDLACADPEPARHAPCASRAAARDAFRPDAELLLGVPAQRWHAALAGRAGVGQPRVPLVRLDHRAAGAPHRLDDAARRRGAAVDRARALHGPAAPRPERRGRLALPLVVPEHPVLRRGRREHDVQDPLQRVRREHRRPGAGRREAGAGADADARAGGRADDGGPDQGPRRVPGRRARPGTRAWRASSGRTRCCRSWRPRRASRS